MAGSALATAYVRIRAEDGGVGGDIKRITTPAATSAGADAGRGFMGRFRSALRDGARQAMAGLDNGADAAGSDAGRTASRGFAGTFLSGVRAGAREALGSLDDGAGEAGASAGRQYAAGLKRTAGDGVSSASRDLGDKSSRGFISSLRSGLGGVTVAFSGALGALGVFQAISSVFSTGLSEVLDASRNLAQTQAVIRSTGGAARVTAAQVTELSSAIEKNTGIDGDNIQAGENMLLTFTNIRNRVGAGNDIFNQATQAMTDMSTAMGTDAASTAMQLGKALNDPVKGMTVLQRSGVTFTDAQKKMVKSMMAAGNVAGAQKIILAELNKEFGGSAKAFGDSTAGQVEKAKRAWESFSASTVNAIIPRLVSLGGIAKTALTPFVSGVKAKLAEAFSAGGSGTGMIEGIKAKFSELAGIIGPTLGPLAASIGAFLGPLLTQLVGFGQQVGAVLGPAFTQIAQIFATQLVPAIQAILPVLQPVASFLINIIGGAVVGAVKGAVNVIKGVLMALSGVLNIFAGLFTGDWSRLWQGVKQLFSGAWSAIKGVVEVALNVGVLGAIRKFATAGIAIFKGIGPGAVAAFRSMASGVEGAISGMAKGGVSLLKTMGSGILSAGRSAMTGLLSAVKGGVSSVTGAITGMASKIVAVVKGIPGQMAAIGGQIVSGLAQGIRSAAGRVTDAAASVVNKIPLKIRQLMGIASPSKVMAALGRWIPAGFAQGILSGSGAVSAAARSMAAKVDASALVRSFADLTAKLKAAGFGANSALATYLKGAEGTLTRLVTARDAVTAKLKAAQDNLTAVLQEAAAFSADIQAKAMDTSWISQENVTFGSIITSLQDRVYKVWDLNRTLTALKAAGLNATSLRQLTDAGVDALPAAQAMLAAGKAGIAQVNQLQAQLGTQAKALATSMTNALYGSGVKAAQGLIAGLKSQQSAIVKQMAAMAAAMVATIKKNLKIKSPSRVMYDVGQDTGQGTVLGVLSKRPALAQAITRFGDAARGLSIPPLDVTAALAVKPSVAAGAGAAGAQPAGQTLSQQDIDRLVDGFAKALRGMAVRLDDRLVGAVDVSYGRGAY